MNLFNLLLTAAALGMTAAAQAAITEPTIPLVTCGTPNDRVTFTSNFPVPAAWKNTVVNHAISDEDTHSVQFDVKIGNNDEIRDIIFWRDVNGERQIAHARNNNGTYWLYLPYGTWHVLACGFLNYMEGSFYIYNPAFVHSRENTLTINPSTGHRTNIRCLAPDGDPLVISGYSSSAGNCTGGRATTVVMFNDEIMSAIDVGLYVDGQNYITTDGVTDEIKIIRIQQMASGSKGIMEMIIPVDVTKSEVATTTEGWKSTELQFALTPTNIIANEIRAKDGEEYSFFNSYLLQNGEWQATIGQGIGGEGATTAAGRVNFWGGYDIDCPISVIFQPAGAALSGADSSIRALPMQATADGIEVLTPNTMFETNMMCATNESIPFLRRNSL